MNNAFLLRAAVICWALLTAVSAQGQALDLAESPAWRALLHFDGQASRIDAPAFFLHPEGHADPRKELLASVERLRAEPDLRCRYPARFGFLKQHWPEYSALQRPSCPEYDRWRQKLNPDAATLIFASAYLGNPSSMFGHTFLRLDHAGSPLLAWVVNFAAQTHDPVSMRFAIKGATGGYPGRFGFAPYYEKITEYARLEQRDLWEYPLQLSADERDRLLAHLWEMREVWFDYYFFQENCSFQLLALLQTVRPELALTQGFTLFAAPLDTLRRLQEFGLLAEPVWRPAAPTALRLRIKRLNASEQDWLQRSVRARNMPANAPIRPEVLDILVELAEYRMSADSASGWKNLRQQALQHRSSLPSQGALPSFHAAAPEHSHFSQRAVVGWRQQAQRSDLVLSWRPVLHDALDGALGWPRGGEISVLDTRLALDDDSLVLDSLNVFSIAALPLRDAWFQPWSWQLGVGYQRDWWNRQGFLRADGGVGLTFGWSDFPSLRHSYLLKGALLADASGQRALESSLEFKLQGQWNLSWPWLLQWRLSRRDGRMAEAHQWHVQAYLGQQWQLSQAWALRAEFHARNRFGQSQWQLAMAHYF